MVIITIKGGSHRAEKSRKVSNKSYKRRINKREINGKLTGDIGDTRRSTRDDAEAPQQRRGTNTMSFGDHGRTWGLETILGPIDDGFGAHRRRISAL